MTIRRRALASERVELAYDTETGYVGIFWRNGQDHVLTLREARDLARTLQTMLRRERGTTTRRPTVGAVARIEGER